MTAVDRRGVPLSATDTIVAGSPNPGLAIKTAVRVVGDVNVNLSSFGLGTLSGVALDAGDRVLLAEQDDATENGIYAASSGVWQRTSDFTSNSQVANGLLVRVTAGLAAGSGYTLACDEPVVLGTTELNFTPDIGFATMTSAQLASKISDETGSGALVFGTAPTIASPAITGALTVNGVAARIRLSADTNFYVATTGNDTTGTGLTVGSPKLTVQAIIDLLARSYDLAAYQAIINVANGTYSGTGATGWIVKQIGPFTGGNPRGTSFPSASVCPVLIRGNTGSPGNVIFTSSGSNTILADAGAYFGIEGVRINNTFGSGSCIRTGTTASVLFGNCILGAAGDARLYAAHSSVIEAYSNYWITGDSAYIHKVAYNGSVFVNSVTETQLSNITVTAYAKVYDSGSALTHEGVTLTTGGFTFTGKKFEIGNGGSIKTGTNNLSLFPGSTKGTISWGSYDDFTYLTSPLTINLNATVPAAPSAGTALQVVQADSTGLIAVYDCYGSTNIQQLRTANGTIGAPTKILSGGSFGFYGMAAYATTAGFGNNQTYINAKAKEDFNDNTHRGTSLILGSTPIASGTARTAAELYDGLLTLGVAGVNVGAVAFNNATSGTITVSPPAGALGTVALTLPTTAGTLAITAATVATVKKQTFTASGNYTPSTGMLYCIIETWGGGGAGGSVAGSASPNVFGGAGGGAGSYSWAIKSLAQVQADGTFASGHVTVTIGAGGTPGAAGSNNGGNGGDTSVGALCIGKGATGGAFTSIAQNGGGGAGGVAGTGDLTGVGAPGRGGHYQTITGLGGESGWGGNTSLGGGAAGKVVAGDGNAASANTGGGGSGGWRITAADSAGGAGGSGIVRITEFCSV